MINLTQNEIDEISQYRFLASVPSWLWRNLLKCEAVNRISKIDIAFLVNELRYLSNKEYYSQDRRLLHDFEHETIIKKTSEKEIYEDQIKKYVIIAAMALKDDKKSESLFLDIDESLVYWVKEFKEIYKRDKERKNAEENDINSLNYQI